MPTFVRDRLYSAQVSLALQELPKYRSELHPATLGKWEIDIQEIKGDELGVTIHNAQCDIGEPEFRRRKIHPGTYRRLIRGGKTVVMSDTRAEMMDAFGMAEYVLTRQARTMLINGLGLGVTTQYLLDYVPSLEHIDIVEIDLELIGLTGIQFFHDPRVTIHHADAFTMKWPKGQRWDVAWHDIWDGMVVENLPEMTKLHRKYRNSAVKQFSWGREALQSVARRRARQERMWG